VSASALSRWPTSPTEYKLHLPEGLELMKGDGVFGYVRNKTLKTKTSAAAMPITFSLRPHDPHECGGEGGREGAEVSARSARGRLLATGEGTHEMQI
jgi:hypothetical protein